MKLSLFAELRRRNVFKAAAAYLALGWVVTQVTSTVAPPLHLPEWIVPVVVWIGVIGFPFVIMFSWIYELTPEGLKRESEVDRSASITHITSRRLDYITISLLVLAIGLFAFDRFVPRRVEPPTASREAQTPAVSSASIPSAASAAPAAPAKSIAVLPFENLSEDKANAYFATGMQDEILTRLASIRDLKVIARTSMLKYQSHPEDLRTVGAQLGVASVLEGSVQRAGEQVRINLQLIDARDDSHLWAQSYDREIKDIFTVERDVAQSVTDAVKAQLMPAEAARVAATPTEKPAAYDLYLRGMAHFNKAYDQDVLTATEMPQAIALFEQALAADPKFALADAQLAYAHISMYFYAGDRTEERLVAAKAAADRALALQPDLGEAHFALALYHYWGRLDYGPAVAQLRVAREALPNSADVVSIIASVARRQNRWDEAIAGFRQATLLDPRSPFPLDQLALAYGSLRRYAEADRAFGQAVALSPDPTEERVTHALNSVWWHGDLAPLRAALGELTPGSDGYAGYVPVMWRMHWFARDYAAAIAVATANGSERWNNRKVYLAVAYRAAGNAAAARAESTAAIDSTRAALVQRPDDPGLHLILGFCEAELGRKDDALREGRKAAELMPPSRDVLAGSDVVVGLAALEVRVGDNDAAFEHLRQALALSSGQSISPALLKLDPAWDPIRNDPRFAQLLVLGEGPVKIATMP